MELTDEQVKDGFEIERWLYAGRRSSDGKERQAWVDAEGTERWYAKLRARASIGYGYDVKVNRADDKTTVLGQPEVADSDADERSAVWEAEDRAAMVVIRRASVERKARSDSRLDELLAELHEVYAGVKGWDRRTAFVQYATLRIVGG